MKSPTRLADANSPASEALRKVLGAAREDLPGDRRLKTIGAGLGALAGGSSAAPAAAAGAFAQVAVKVGVAVTAIVAVTGAGLVASRAMLARPGARASSGATASSAAGPVFAAAPVAAHVTLPAPAPPGSDPKASSAAVLSFASPVQPAPRPRGNAPVSAVAPPPTRPPGKSPPTSPGDLALSANVGTSSDRQMGPGAAGLIAAGDHRDPAASSTAIAPAPTEIDLLGRAEGALRTNPSLALALVNEDAARFPGGALAQEREVIAIEALLGLGRLGDARAEATRLFHDAPDTAHRARVEALLAAATDASIHNR
jgi:hypothetical protein